MKTPPNHTSADYPITILAFSKQEGTVSSTFYCRLVTRAPLRLTHRDGTTSRVVRYEGRFWPIYQPDEFNSQAKRWVGSDDQIYDQSDKPIKTPISDAFLFECDQPFGHYD